MKQGFAVMLMALVLGQPAAFAADTQAAAPGAVASGPEGPADTVAGFHATLVEIMQRGSELGCNGRNQRVGGFVETGFDLPFIAQRVLKQHWKELSAAQQAQFTAQMKDLTAWSYASNFSQHSGESFTTLGATELPRDQRLVRTRLNLPGRDAVSFDYWLRQSGGRWRIINVIADGVSDLALRTTQYDRLIAEKGVNGLLGALSGEIARLRSSCK